MKAAFTLLELICTVAVLAVLASVAVPATNRATAYLARTKSIANLRQLGVAARLYANDHEQKLPGQNASPLLPLGGADEAATQACWPKLLCDYLSPSDPRVLLDPLDPAACQLTTAEILSDQANNTGYVYNGFDDLGSNGLPLPEVPLTAIDSAVNVVLISQKSRGAHAFYVNLLSAPLASILTVVDPAAYNGGSFYLYLDGSVRYLKEDQYSNKLWLVNKDLSLPSTPFHNNLGPQCLPGPRILGAL